jgi:uncharacterized Zn-binding protein involved in type VI secretion
MNNFNNQKTNKISRKQPPTKTTRNTNTNPYPPPPPPPPSNSKPNKITNMFTNRQKWPVVIAFIIALALGAVGFGYIGLIVGVIAGIFLLTKFSNYKISFTPWQTAVTSFLPMIAKILYFMILLLPVADYLTLPSGHTPDSFVKYISIMIAVPSNFVSGAPNDVFPGIPIVVLISIILMVIGGLNLQKTKYFVIALSGLLLYSVSPAIASVVAGRAIPPLVIQFYAIGYYLAWIGLILIVVSKILPKFIKKTTLPPPPPQNNSLGLIVPFMLLPLALTQIISLQPHALISVVPVELDFESAHHLGAGFLAALFAALGAGLIVNQEGEDDVDSLTIELTYPAGRSPKVFTTGWVFGARAILNAGKPNEEDVSNQVKWSGSGSFSPAVGSRSRPSFYGAGPNTITLTIDTKSQSAQKDYQVEAISPAGYASVTDKAQCPSDSHGCLACPHPVVGPILSGSPNVLVNGRPAARQGDPGMHAACCGPNTFTIAGGDPEVLIDGRPAAKIGTPTQHCGGTGQIISGSPA